MTDDPLVRRMDRIIRRLDVATTIYGATCVVLLAALFKALWA